MSSIKAPEEFDQYGNPVHGQTIGVTTGVGRSGSSSSTSSVRSFSSEDDGQGGIRKKGLKEKIKDKLPGQGHEDEQAYQTSTPATAGASREGHMDSSGHYREKKGMVETIKEKLPLHARHQH